MVTDRERWDARHSSERGQPPRAPDAFVLEVLRDLGPGAGRPALDLGCGTGRHALLLAEQGFATSAWDVSPAGLGILSERAQARELAIEVRAVDLTAGWPPDSPPVSLLVVVDFLDRTLFGELRRRVCPGGSVVLATFTDDWPEPHPSRRFRLRSAELRAGLPGLETRRYAESGGRAGLWAQAREDS